MLCYLDTVLYCVVDTFVVNANIIDSQTSRSFEHVCQFEVSLIRDLRIVPIYESCLHLSNGDEAWVFSFLDLVIPRVVWWTIRIELTTFRL